MDQSAPQPTFELPPQGSPRSEVAGAPMQPETPVVRSQEQLGQPGNTPSAAPMQPVLPPLPPQAGAPLAPLPAPAAHPMPRRSTLAAADADLIEKEWVVKAKAIVEQTSRDPYVQNKEINKVKAEYLQKRYNKTIPVNDK